jgi:hypothetical protein
MVEGVIADATGWGANKAAGLQALRDLRATRRRHYAAQVDWIEAGYRLYLGVIFGGWGLALISGALADVRVNAHALQQIHQRGPAALGLLVAVAVAAGLRSGARGGPLVLEAPDVQHVLLAPVDRGAALRGLAVRRIRTMAFLGVVVGLIAGIFAFRRLPGHPAEWLVCGGVFGAAVAVAGVSAALIASGRRLHRAAVWVLAMLIVGWSVADFLGQRVTSPASMLGALALWPLHRVNASFVLPAAGLLVVAVGAVFGLTGLAGTSLEAARRRAGLAAQLRFAVTTQDLRAIILLRRQLASEIPRRRPWLQLAQSEGSHHAIWQRDWQSFLRWPVVRVLRICVLGVLAGLSLLAAWRGTTPLVLVAAFALMVAAFDAVEPIGQEVDHPTLLALLPVSAGLVVRRHLVAPSTLMAGVSLIAAATAVVAGAPGDLIGVAVVMIIPTALLSLSCAALSVTNDPFAYVLTPELGYFQTGFPVALVIVGVSGPVLLAREAARHGSPAVGAAIGFELAAFAISLIVIAWLTHRIGSRVPVRS